MKNKFVDSILPFQIDDKNLRGRFARLEKLASDALKNHRFPDEVCTLLIEALLLTVLIGEMIKIKWKLSLQVRGNDSIKLLATDYYAPKKEGNPARVRAYADYDKDAAHLSLESGLFAITIDQGKIWSHIRASPQLLRAVYVSLPKIIFSSQNKLRLFLI
jgi:molecular chaperone Hsp33